MPFCHRRRRRARPRRRRFRRRRARRRTMVVDPEKKFINTENAGVNQVVTNIGFTTLLNSTIQAVSGNGRIGIQQLNVMSNMSYRVQLGPTSVPSIVRVALVVFKQPRAVGLNLNEVWEDNATVFAPLSNRVLVTAFQYKVLWTRTHRLSLDKQTAGGRIMKPMRLKTRFNGTGGGIGAIESGALYLIGVSDLADQGAAPLLKWVSRVRFVG